MEPMSSEPPAYSPASPLSLEDRKTATFAQVESHIFKAGPIPPVFAVAFEAFREYMAVEEVTKIARNQLGVLRALSVILLEFSAQKFHGGSDVSETLINVTQTLQHLSSDIKSNRLWEYATHNLKLAKYLETKIASASEKLEEELRVLLEGSDLETTAYKNELLQAQRVDQEKMELFEAIVNPESQRGESLNVVVQQSMEENLKIIGDPTVEHKQVEAKRALAILTELTGASLPPSTLLGRDFVTIGSRSIHSSANFEIFRGQYFTGEEIAIKVLRHRVDAETATKTHQRFARQALNWSVLRHDAILPFYGVGVADSGVVPGEAQLYMVSPYLQNQDVRRYLRKYPTAPLKTRLRMVLDVARGLNHMHQAADLPEPSNGMVHSALNIFNILIKDSGRAVISGFGHSKVIRDFYESFTGDNSEYRYMGPEMMQDEARVTYGTDTWSWAMTALEILTDVPPFGEKTKGPRLVTLLAQMKRPQRSDHPKLEEYSDADKLWDLFTECWDEDPTARPSAENIVSRIRPMLQELGKKSETVEQPKDLAGPYGKTNQAGRATSPVRSGQPPAQPPGETQLGRSTQPVVPGSPPPPPPSSDPHEQR